MSGMGYGMGKDGALARRRDRLAARYGTPTPAAEESTIKSVGGFSVAWVDDDEAVALGAAPIDDEPTPKKKGGRPRGSKNKGT